jgi:superoxide reductase
MKIFICSICGHLEFNTAPEKCPVCFAEKDKFKQNDAVFKESSEKSPEAAVKHVPAVVISKQCGLIPETSCFDVNVRIGKTMHPMEEKHFIQFIDCYQNEKYICRVMFTPVTINPAACFHLKNGTGKITVVENCNIHGYWMIEVAL